MIYLDVRPILEDRAIENPYKFLMKNGFTYHSAYKLLNDSSGTIKFRSLEKLCLALNCSIEDILVWQPDSGMNNAEDHPLFRLKGKIRKGNIKEKLKGLSVEKLQELRSYIEKL